MPTLYLIRGVSGSGKTTLAEKMQRCDMVDFVYEADHYFYQDGVYKFEANKLGKAHEICQECTCQALLDGYNVAVSNTSTTEKEVDTYRKIAQDTGAQFVSIIVENRHGGKNVHGVPDEKLEQMRQRFSVKL